MQLMVFAAAIIIVNIAAVSGALALDQNLPPYQELLVFPVKSNRLGPIH